MPDEPEPLQPGLPEAPSPAPSASQGALDFSVVVPVYNSQESLEELHTRLAATLSAMGKTFEVIYVDDGSRDGSMSTLRSLHERHPGQVRVVSLYRNQGQHAALMCGFRLCRGDFVVTLDDDLQHSPEDIPALYERLQQGYDAVFGSYVRKAHGPVQNLGSRLLGRLNRRIFGLPRGLELSAYRIIRRGVVDHIRSHNTSYPYVSGLIASTTVRIANVPVRHEPRRYGKSGYTLPKLIRLAFNLLINYSAIPLKAMAWVGMGAALLAFAVGAVFMIRQFVIDDVPQGWTSLVVLMSFFSGVVFAMMFVMAEYLSRLLREASDRPMHAVRETLE